MADRPTAEQAVPDRKPRSGGRPALPADKKLKVKAIRLNDEQAATLERVGQQALRDWLDSLKA